MRLRAATHPAHMLRGKFHDRHASHAGQNSQENSSATGRKNYLKGKFRDVLLNGTVRAVSSEQSEGPEMFSGPSSAEWIALQKLR
jgi:hypothetical protein